MAAYQTPEHSKGRLLEFVCIQLHNIWWQRFCGLLLLKFLVSFACFALPFHVIFVIFFLLVLVLTLLSVVVLPSSVAVSCGASGCS